MITKRTFVVQAIGIDVGPTPGLVSMIFQGVHLLEHHVVQCSASSAVVVLETLIDTVNNALIREGGPHHRVIQAERFVIGRGSMRTGRLGALTRDQLVELQNVATETRSRWNVRSASEVKPWATDIRLGRTPLLEATKGMRHARDAARHALFTAVHDAHLPDPMSREARYR